MVVSAVTHVVVISTMAIWRTAPAARESTTFVWLAERETAPSEIEVIYTPPAGARDVVEPELSVDPRRLQPPDETAEPGSSAPAPILAREIASAPAAAPSGEVTGVVDSGAVGVRSSESILGGAPIPRYGGGVVWVEPLGAYILPSDIEMTFNANPGLRERVQAIFDSVQAEMLAQRARGGDWTVNIPGLGKLGFDEEGWLHIGPIKLPSIVLALLPLDFLGQGNYDEIQRAEMLSEMRRDLLYAAQRAETVEEFKEEVKAIRERRQAERDAERGRRRTAEVIP